VFISFLPSFLLALQLRVGFGLLNNLPPFFSPSEADYVVSEQFSFYSVRLLPHAQPPAWRTRVSLFVWPLPLDLSGMGDPTSSYATTGIALRVSGALKPHHLDKVETPLVGLVFICLFLILLLNDAVSIETVWFQWYGD
jgi:hypothetical protein